MKRAWAVLLLVGCAPVGATALDDPEARDFFARPWPDDARRSSDGRHLDLADFARPGGTSGELVGGYLQTIAAAPLDGFGTQSAIYFRFDAPLDSTSLPASPSQSLADAAAAFLIDTTPGSPTYGKRTPLIVRFEPRANGFIGPNWLALVPLPGFPLRERTRYTAVLTDALRAADDGPVRPARAPRLDADALAVIGTTPSRIVAATTFTTQAPTALMPALRRALYEQAAPPAVADLTWVSSNRRYDLYEGHFSSANFQEGVPPYLHSGGQIHLGADGRPERVRGEELRVALSVPRGTMPPSGWPVILFAHGTGGSYLSFVEDGSASSAARVIDPEDNEVARFAMVSTDQVLHGPRDPTASDPDLTFFNLSNLAAARDNAKQGALDDFQVVRLVESFSVAQAPSTGVPIRFDPDRIYFKGHSQGGITGALFLAFEPKVRAAILSGAGANLVLALLGKTQPTDIAGLIETLVGEPVDQFHPLLNLLQTYIESSDPANYARRLIREPPTDNDGRPLAPKSIFQSIGVVDHWTPNPALRALALAIGLQPVEPVIDPLVDPADQALAPAAAAPPLAGNLAGEVPGGPATGVVREYTVPVGPNGAPRYDGHYVLFRDYDAVTQSNLFLATDAASGVATLLN